MRTLVFTDLDGTLLAHDSYSWAGARPALQELRRRRIPLIFCTSKTRAEVRSLRTAMGNTDPFIVENGGVVVIPSARSSRNASPEKTRARSIVLGRPYDEVVAALRKIARRTHVAVVGFHEMSDQQVAEKTGLSVKEAHLARERETGEPFLFRDASNREIRAFVRAAHELGYTVQRGGRFWHFSANCDKGLALSTVVSFYRAAWKTDVLTIGLGNSENDLPMLQLVDQPILMPEMDGSYAKAIMSAVPGVVRAADTGPAGWGRAVLRALVQNSGRAPGSARPDTSSVDIHRQPRYAT